MNERDRNDWNDEADRNEAADLNGPAICRRECSVYDARGCVPQVCDSSRFVDGQGWTCARRNAEQPTDPDSEHRRGDWNDDNPDPDERDLPPARPDATVDDYCRQAIALAEDGLFTAAGAVLNRALRIARTLGDVWHIEAAGLEYGTRMRSKRATRYCGHRDLFSFSASHACGYAPDVAATRVAYLYDDSVSVGECEVANLWKVAKF